MNTNSKIAEEALSNPINDQRRNPRICRHAILKRLIELGDTLILFHWAVPFAEKKDHPCINGSVQVVGWDLGYLYVKRFITHACQQCVGLHLQGSRTADIIFYDNPDRIFQIAWDKIWVDYSNHTPLWVNTVNISIFKGGLR